MWLNNYRLSNIELIICTEKGYLESASKVLIHSLREFGGAYKNIPIYSYQPRKEKRISNKTIMFFEKNNVIYRDIELNKNYKHYPLANKPLVCAYHEKNSKADSLIFMDSDQFFFNAPHFFSTERSLKMRPEDIKNIGGVMGSNSPNEKYWLELYRLLNVKDFRFVKTKIDNEEIFEYYNSGLIQTNRENYLFGAWLENFKDVMRSGLTPVSGNYYVEQSVLSATISKLKLPVEEFPTNYNFPLHLFQFSDDEKDQKIFKKIVTAHYHGFFHNRKKSIDFFQLIQNDKSRSIKHKMLKYGVISMRKNLPYRLWDRILRSLY